MINHITIYLKRLFGYTVNKALLPSFTADIFKPLRSAFEVPTLEQMEADIIPYSPSAPEGRRVLVLAPHPDDETLGCGGSLILLRERGAEIKVLFLTKGEKADPTVKDPEEYAVIRQEEAMAALTTLGISDYRFLGHPDRGLYTNFHKCLQDVKDCVSHYKPDTLYCPSPLELNPDHRVAATISVLLFRECKINIAFYEISVPFRPNRLITITEVMDKKIEALEAYRSQCKLINYVRLINALNGFRSLTLNGCNGFVEAFYILSH